MSDDAGDRYARLRDQYAPGAQRQLAVTLYVDVDGDNEPTLWFPADGGRPTPLFRRCDVGETGWAIVVALLNLARAPRVDQLPGVRWECPRCHKQGVVVGNLRHVRCTCGTVSEAPTPADRTEAELEVAALEVLTRRLSWASMHWGTEDVHPDAWLHIAKAFVDAGWTPPAPARTIPARRTDPATSHAATEAVTVRAGTQRHRLLAAFGLPAAVQGLTDEEAADLADGVPYRSEYAKRCSELRAGGLIDPTGDTRPGVAGHERIVSRITDRGRAELARLSA